MQPAIERYRKPITWVLVAAGLAALLLVLAPGFAELQAEESPAVLSAEEPSPGKGISLVVESSASGSEPLEYAALDPAEDRLAGAADGSWPETGGAGPEDASTLACIIEPNRVVAIGSPITGIIDDVPVERADVVEKGQVLVKLESHVEQATVELARTRAEMNEGVEAGKVRLELGEAKHSRVNKLFESDALSKDLQEEAETEKELAQLELDRAHKEKQLAGLELERALAVLERRTIYSPFAGVVVDRAMSPGERVDQETILKVAQIDPLRVEVILPSVMFGSIEQGARATVVPEIPGDTVHVANVAIVDRVVDSASGTFGVRLELPNPDHAIPGGVHCQVRFLEE